MMSKREWLFKSGIRREILCRKHFLQIFLTDKKGEPIIKYGEEIGVATADIDTGAYVHVHNLDSQRARGDLK